MSGPDATPADAPPPSYPPEHHVLRDLPFSLEAVDGSRSRAHLTVTPEVRAGGGLSAGPLMTVIDVLAGSLVGRVLAPDWMATAQLSLHLAHPPGTGEVVAEATVIRAGRTTVVVDVGLHGAGPDGTPFGEAMLTFVRLPRRDTTIDLSTFEVRYGERSSFATEASGLTRPFAEQVGVVVQDAPSGVVRVDVTDYVRNSFGAVNGGVVASVAVEAARAACRSLLGDGAVVADAVVHYLTQGRVGPLVTTSRVVRSDRCGALVRVEVADAGDPEPSGGPRVMVVAHVHCLPGAA